MYAESHNEVIIRDKYNLCILRFNDQGDTDIEVRNSKTIGNWEAEKKDTPSWSFTPGQPFVIEIKADTDQYVVG